MYVDVKIHCACGAVGVCEVELEERRSESGCGCCPGNGTGEFYLTEPYSLPEGWRKDGTRYTSRTYRCPKCV